MKLSRAFTVRARLTNAYNVTETRVKQAKISTLVDLETATAEPVAINLDQEYVNLCTIGDILARLNAAIDKANANSKARELLSRITNVNRKFDLVKRECFQLEQFKPVEKVFDNYAYDEKTNSRGKYVTKNYQLITQVDWTAEAEKLAREKLSYEDELAEVNASTDVELDEEILSTLKNLGLML